MLLAIGTKIQLKTTGEKGSIIAMLGNGMVCVRLSGSGLEIPCFEDDVTRLDAVPAPEVLQPAAGYKAQPVASQYTILKSAGLQLAFDPHFNREGQTEHFDIYLLNDTSYGVAYVLSFWVNKDLRFKQNGKIDAVTSLKLGQMKLDDLNELPTLKCEFWPITTAGTGSRIQIELKIKAKQFFKKITTAPLLNRPVHLYLLVDRMELSGKQEEETEDLRSYTQRNMQPGSYGPSFESVHDVHAYASFPTEIDLHIETLANNHHKLSNADILRVQLAAFDKFLQQAIRLGIPRVFAIHGVGKGKLRDTIATRLMQNPDVITFKNEFHPRYGWGATEIILQESA